jgi:lipopolysaccharide biosynthesis glycosyltransferase
MQPYVLCSSANETYAMGLAVALASALRHAPAAATYRVYVLDGGIRDFTWRRIERSLRLTGRKLELIRLLPKMSQFAGLPQDWGASVMTYARLALPELVRESRIFYIDSDLVVQGDWTKIFHLALGENVIGAATDIIAKTLSNEPYDFARFQLDPRAPSLQAGVMLIDLEKWRAERISEKTLTYLRENPAQAKCWDQSALNVVLYGRWLSLPVEWNIPGWWADLRREGCSPDAAVLHFVGPNKPWLIGFDQGAAAERFFAELDHTDWRGWRPSRARFLLKLLKYRLSKLLAR